MNKTTINKPNCDENCLHPRRPVTEELFNKLNHHERSTSLDDMFSKLKVYMYISIDKFM
jgi:hypothetical protein